MIDIITTIAKYLIIIMCLIYTLSCYTVFRPKNRDRKEDLLDNQVIYMFVFLFLCYTVLFLQEFELKILIFFAAQVIFFEILMIVFPRIYKRCSRPLINNTCFLLGVGFVILTRLSFDLAMKQFAIAAGSVIVTSFIPLMMHKITIWNKFGWLYAVAGFLLLSTVFVFSGIMHLVDPELYVSPVLQLLTGGLMLGAIFMATDYVTSPMSKKGMLIYGVCIGLLTVIIRLFGAYPEGMSFAILIMNAFTPLINTYCKPKRFGEVAKKK